MKRGLACVVLVVCAACVKEHQCRDGTVFLTVQFRDNSNLVDGLALSYLFDNENGTPTPISSTSSPLMRPSEKDQGNLELQVANYADHKSLTLQYVPTKGTSPVGDWQNDTIPLERNCSTSTLEVRIKTNDGAVVGVDAGADSVTDGFAQIPDVQTPVGAMDGAEDTAADRAPDFAPGADMSLDVPIRGSGGTGGTTATGGTSASGGQSGATSVGGLGGGGDAGMPDAPVTQPDVPTGGVQATDGSVAAGGDSGSGCSGSYEAIQTGTGLCVANMATIPAPSGYSDYSIDVTEVTRGQYAMWLATTTAATISGQDSATCGWNTTFVPDSLCMGAASVCKSDCDHHPQVCVDWCDAFAYCKGVGKRLCGKIGGGANASMDDANSNASQWYRACSSAGINTYPYGNYYSKPICNGIDYWSSTSIATTLPVGSLKDCHGAAPYSGVYDLSGNVWEWEDSCDGFAPLARDYCHNRGGSFSMDSGFIACGIFSDVGQRNTPDDGTGFRCCSL